MPDSPRLLESIRLIDGAFPLLPYHQARVDRSWKKHFPNKKVPRLQLVIAQRGFPEKGLYKYRMEYDAKDISVSIEPYLRKSIQSLQLVEADDLRYPQKYVERSHIQALYDQRGDCDDVLLCQGGYLTDTSYANIALYDGRQWFTPAWPLLRGTRRAKLIDDGILQTSMIRPKDLSAFQKIRLINAMLPWSEAPTLDVNAIAIPATFSGTRP